jgi:nitrogen fixation NifU-like protein
MYKDGIDLNTGAVGSSTRRFTWHTAKKSSTTTKTRATSAPSEGRRGVATGMVGAPACGDVMKLQIKVNKDGIIEDAKFKTYGCGSAIASSSLVTEWVKGKTVDEAAPSEHADRRGARAPPVKIHCSILAEDAIKAAIADYRRSTAAASATGQEGGGLTWP